MASIRNAYRRGAIYWWRRQISLGSGAARGFYLSLRTSRPAEARRRAGALTVASDDIKHQILRMSGFILTGEMRQRIFQVALQRQLDRIIADQVDQLESPEEHRRANSFFAALYRVWARRGGEAEVAEADLDLLRAEGWAPEDIVAFQRFAARTPSHSLVSRVRTEELLSDCGVPLTGTNLRHVYQIVFEARARACIEASRHAGSAVPYAGTWATEVIPDGGVSEIVVQPPARTESASSPPASAPRRPVDEGEGTSPAATQAAEPIGSGTISVVLEEWISNWSLRRQDVPTLKQYAQSVRLLVRLLGDTPLASLSEELLELFAKKTERLALNYRMGSKRDILVPEGYAGPSGLSPVTLQRHFTGIGVFLDWARRRYKDIPKLDMTGLAPKATSVRARDKRQSWSDEECARMLRTPPFTGCLGSDSVHGRGAVHERLQPGPHVFHDAWYWPLLLFYYTGARREEICKLLVSDVGEEDGIAFISIKPTITGRLKNVQSERLIPIHSELIRLGFLDFVRHRTTLPHLAINNQGVSDWELFPELRPGGESDYGSMYYKRVWRRFLPVAMGDDAGERDIHSFRHGFSGFLDATKCSAKEANDLFGHETATTRGKVYGERTPLRTLAAIIEQREPITRVIAARSSNVPPLLVPLPPFVARHQPTSTESRKSLRRHSARR